MKHHWINVVALFVIAFGAHASGSQTNVGATLAYNVCEGGGLKCYCSRGCSANSSGCTCH